MITDDVDELLDAGRIIIRGMMRFDFATGTYGFWTGSSVWNYNGLDYLPGGIIEVSNLPGQWGMNAAGVEISLAVSKDDGLTPEVLASIESEIYHQRPITISDAFIHPDTNALLLVEPLYRGFVDRIEHSGGADGKLTVYCESRFLDNARQNYRVRSDADQKLVSANDSFFYMVESVSKKDLWWGRAKK